MLTLRRLSAGWIIDGPEGSQGPYPSLKDTLANAQTMIAALRAAGVVAEITIEA